MVGMLCAMSGYKVRAMTYYLYRNTTQKSEVIAQFPDRESALELMEQLATREGNPLVSGYSVRDQSLAIYADFEI